jgi:histidine triad (HIT) family protein
MSVIGLEVPHAHVHLIPIEKIKDATFQSKTSINTDEMENLSILISKAVKQIS